MTGKETILSHFIWLASVLSEAQSTIDVIDNNRLVKQSLKNRINGLKLEIDKFFSDDRFNNFYISGGAEGLQKLIELHENSREQYLKALFEDNA